MNEYSRRGGVILLVVGFIYLIYIFRLLYLQVLSEEYALQAQVHDIDNVTLFPSRGIIYDRNENKYVKNTPLFTVMFMPRDFKISDTTVLEKYLGLDRQMIRDTTKRKYGIVKRNSWLPLADRLNKETYNRFIEHAWKFEGIQIVTKHTREYNYHAGANFLGYINEVSPGELKYAKATGDTVDFYYVQRDPIGKIGIEKYYEKLLRGRKGRQLLLRDNLSRAIGSYANGKYDELPESGRDIMLGIDARLQELGEQLMQNKRGSVVAIEPSTGQVLAFISAPSYDPTLLSGHELGKHYNELVADPELPLINRPLTAQYPPGSIFKILQALAAMSEGIIDENTHFGCGGAWGRNRGKPACHGAHGSVNLATGIKHSCNAYFAEVYYQFLTSEKFASVEDAHRRWREIMLQYGIGNKLGIDIPDEKPGNIPTAEFYDRWYGKGKWGALTIYSNSIGQGEILMTPLQMANTAAMIANRGWYFPPHFLVATKKSSQEWEKIPYQKIVVPGKASHYTMVVDAMEQVVLSGTATRAKIDSISVCGKTGTVENKAGEDHSVFMAFAPKDNPKIAIAAIVENAGFGGTWSAPICSLMMEYYLKGHIKNQAKLKRIIEADFRNIDVEKQGEAL